MTRFNPPSYIKFILSESELEFVETIKPLRAKELFNYAPNELPPHVPLNPSNLS